MPVQVERKCKIKDVEIFLAMGHTYEELEIYSGVKSTMDGTGHKVEEYLAYVSRNDPNVQYVAKMRNRPLSTDFIIGGVKWSIKNAIHTENWTAKKGREADGVYHQWYRRDDNGNYYWHTCPIKGCSEDGFRSFLKGNIEDFEDENKLHLWKLFNVNSNK